MSDSHGNQATSPGDKNTPAKTSDLLIMVPTYNERENASALLEQLNALGLKADMLFIDDSSPDGTGELLEILKKQYPHLIVLHREEKNGIGSAHMVGIRWAYQQGYKTLVTMDCDFTHPPEYIPKLFEPSQHADIVVGSRYLNKKSLRDWNLYRKALTYLGHGVTRSLLKMPYDATGAFRLYRLDKISSKVWDIVASCGYAFFFESLYILNINGYKILEIPMALPARTNGHSKMNWREVLRSVKLLLSLYLTAFFNREKITLDEPLPQNKIDPNLQDKQGWDQYWDKKSDSGHLLYNIIAHFYRKVIIRPALNHFVKKYFSRGQTVLHAGCGSGQVDADIKKYVQIIALDISPVALSLYKKSNPEVTQLLHGSLFNIPPHQKVDGIYNLGVMEHFTADESQKILGEFYRVLKPEGYLILFWPPEFGLSVIFFKILGFILHRFFGKKNVKFHPDEISRLRSRDHACQVLTQGKFKLLEYSFGPRDCYTHAVLVAQKELLTSSSPH